MKKSKIMVMWSSVLIVLVILVAGFTVFALSSEQNTPISKLETSKTMDDREYALKELANDKVEVNRERSVQRDKKLDEKLAYFETQKANADSNDIIVYSILSEYYGNKYQRTDIITDYDMDVSYMSLMIKLLETSDLSANESFVLKQYLARRVDWLDDNTLKTTIKMIIE